MASSYRVTHGARVLKMLTLMLIGFGCTRARLPFPTPKALRSEAQGWPRGLRPTLG